MKVLKNNYTHKDNKEDIEDTNPYPRKHICENCGSELEYEQSDLRIGDYGCAFVVCPCCGEDNYTYDDGITLTKDNVEFPVHFYHTSKESGAVDCCNNYEVKKCIHDAINYFRENKSEYYWFCEHGNLRVSVYKFVGDEKYDIVVTNNYYDTHISFEKEDY